MTWIDELHDQLSTDTEDRATTGGRNGQDSEEDIEYARSLVPTLLERMNRELLAGSGSVWETQLAWGLRLWELWWGQTRTDGRYVLVTLLRDSRGAPYLKVQRRRLPLRDPRLERRLGRALRAAFLQPRVYTPKEIVTAGEQDLQRSS